MDAVTEILENSLEVPSLTALWPEINRQYQTMGFSDKLSDSERISEYKYVQSQLAKYVGTKREYISSFKDDLPKMVNAIEELISKEEMCPKERKEIVYVMMKENWLVSLKQLIAIEYEEQKLLEKEE